MKVWITKYALSKGIIVAEVECNESFPEIVTEVGKGMWGISAYGEGKEWHRMEGEAIDRAEEMRIARIASLREQIAKLEKLSFVSEVAR